MTQEKAVRGSRCSPRFSTLYQTHTLELRPLQRRVRTIAGCSGVATIAQARFDLALETLITEHTIVVQTATSLQYPHIWGKLCARNLQFSGVKVAVEAVVLLVV